MFGGSPGAHTVSLSVCVGRGRVMNGLLSILAGLEKS